MAASRRSFLKGSAATTVMVSAPGLLKAQSPPTAAGTLRTVLHGDLQVFDPIWTTANMTGNHGLLIYDTLFGMDEDRKPQPQMVDKWGVSDDKKTYTFSLRAVTCGRVDHGETGCREPGHRRVAVIVLVTQTTHDQIAALREAGYRQRDIARELGLTQGRVSQILSQGRERQAIAGVRARLPH